MGFFSFEYVGTGLDFRFPTAVMEKYNEIKADRDFLEVQGENCSCMTFALTWLLFCFNFSTVLLENALFVSEWMLGFRRYTCLRFQKNIFFPVPDSFWYRGVKTGDTHGRDKVESV